MNPIQVIRDMLFVGRKVRAMQARLDAAEKAIVAAHDQAATATFMVKRLHGALTSAATPKP